ncbi:hypothetical protein GWI33_022983 [Rhynchophorus ferrugineus]|uniref:Uncharacterized protein n=1 Tax=Rhynchophorus ferrugineus TaxID=354439 RepID=A0A834IPD5_RHYFE|nr:hypothetical protein GWI33_022983 [Rhynchophorus ferrugineus]
MHKIIVSLALIGYVTCASLDHLQYLPPQARGNQGGPDANQPFPAPAAPAGHSPNGGAPGSQQGPSGASHGPHGPAGPGQQRSPLADVPILRLESENPGDGSYRYAYETGNGIAAQEEGSAQAGWTRAHGSYQFTSPEGQNFEVTYTADENGYVPQGAHLPTPPPIPEEILKSLEIIKQAAAEGRLEGQYHPEGDDGQYREGQHYENSNGFPSQNGNQQHFPGNNGEQGQQPVGNNGGYQY